MCGIYGSLAFNKEKKFGDPSLNSLRRRGPDSVGLWRDGNVILGQTRLAVVDEKLSSDQPIVSGDLVLVANGEIYNYKEIRKLTGYRYSGTSDCEAILHVYNKLGIEGFSRLDGFYALALYDKKGKKIILHKDSVGKKPLYVLRDPGGGVLFGSSVTALAENYGKKLTVSRSQIQFYLREGFIHPRETIFNEIVPVLPGEIYEIDVRSGKIKTSFLKKECRGSVATRDETIARDIENLLDEAVAKRVRDLDRPVLLFSGGIDSTAIATFMLRHNPRTQLVSIRQPLPFLHDEPYVRKASMILKVPVQFVNIFTPWFYKKLEEFISCLDQPLAAYGYYYLSALALKAKEYGKVLITGDGGDEVFYGYDSLDRWFAPENSPAAPEILVGPKPAAPLTPYGLRAISVGFLGPDFVKLDKATAEHQMEARCPYLDWDLMCYARRIPADFWLRHGETKYPLKQILRSRGFGPAFINRRKVGFSYPFRTLMMPRYGFIIRSLERNRDLLAYLGAGEESLRTIGFISLYRRFDDFWRLYVLGRFFEFFTVSYEIQ